MSRSRLVVRSCWTHHHIPTGYEARYLSRSGGGQHGCALAWRSSKLQEVTHTDVYFDELAQDFKESEHLTSELTRGNVAQVYALRLVTPPSADTAQPAADADKSALGIVVSNTHLYWNPWYSFVRLFQSHRLLSVLKEVSDKMGPCYPMVALGDFNATPDGPIYHFLTHRIIAAAHMPLFLTPPDHGSAQISVIATDAAVRKVGTLVVHRSSFR
mgnify:CR=1 FL=1